MLNNYFDFYFGKISFILQTTRWRFFFFVLLNILICWNDVWEMRFFVPSVWSLTPWDHFHFLFAFIILSCTVSINYLSLPSLIACSPLHDNTSPTCHHAPPAITILRYVYISLPTTFTSIFLFSLLPELLLSLLIPSPYWYLLSTTPPLLFITHHSYLYSHI